MTDQQRFDAIRRVQDELSAYNGMHKIRTPNLDRLSTQGAYFRTAYVQSPVCGPSRTSIRTGCTIERTGVQTNPLTNEENLRIKRLFQDKIDKLEGLDQILVENHGYVSEYYGKWHIPSSLYYQRTNASELAVQYNDYNYDGNGSFRFRDNDSWASLLRGYLHHFEKQGKISKVFLHGQQEDTYSRYPYTPIPLDTRFGFPVNTPLTTDDNLFDSFETNQHGEMGNYSLSQEYTASYLNHDIAMRALNRLAAKDEPFFLTISYHHPHPPYMAPSEYLDYYWNQRDQLFLPPTAGIPPYDSGYYRSRELQDLIKAGYCSRGRIREWTAIYYALVEQIDALVGIMLNRLEQLSIGNNTLVIFTSDHGEMLGSHCLRGKGTFYEEAVRVPLFIKYPDHIPQQTIVDTPVNLIDLFSTILDYANATSSDRSDGKSLRRFIEQSSINDDFDDTVAVSEWDYREPIDNVSLSGDLDGSPNFLVRHGDFKLFIYKKADSEKQDMLINVADDPFEINNWIRKNGPEPSDYAIGKCEHLRHLLLEWMTRVNGAPDDGYYSDPIQNANEGQGDITEIKNRQSWPALDFWVSDLFLKFGLPTFVGASWVRHEWLYIGRRTVGSLDVTSLRIDGSDAALFRLDKVAANNIHAKEYIKVRVTFESQERQRKQPTNATLIIEHSAGDPFFVQLLLFSDPKSLVSLPHPPRYNIPPPSPFPTPAPQLPTTELRNPSTSSIPSSRPSLRPIGPVNSSPAITSAPGNALLTLSSAISAGTSIVSGLFAIITALLIM
jgi:arylsulfatase A-like enzyme